MGHSQPVIMPDWCLVARSLLDHLLFLLFLWPYVSAARRTSSVSVMYDRSCFGACSTSEMAAVRLATLPPSTQCLGQLPLRQLSKQLCPCGPCDISLQLFQRYRWAYCGEAAVPNSCCFTPHCGAVLHAFTPQSPSCWSMVLCFRYFQIQFCQQNMVSGTGSLVSSCSDSQSYLLLFACS